MLIIHNFTINLHLKNKEESFSHAKCCKRSFTGRCVVDYRQSELSGVRGCLRRARATVCHLK
ncbi:hypothetical protein HanIR_Chr05g0243191 [Helianthus annuus]|nr:hypothetical protein HanIR_Chr05g0243191 [Helianthus annuus]